MREYMIHVSQGVRTHGHTHTHAQFTFPPGMTSMAVALCLWDEGCGGRDGMTTESFPALLLLSSSFLSPGPPHLSELLHVSPKPKLNCQRSCCDPRPPQVNIKDALKLSDLFRSQNVQDSPPQWIRDWPGVLFEEHWPCSKKEKRQSEPSTLTIMIQNIFSFCDGSAPSLIFHGVGCREDVWNLHVCVRSECEG